MTSVLFRWCAGIAIATSIAIGIWWQLRPPKEQEVIYDVIDIKREMPLGY